jgi:transcription factor TFIIIB component B''
MSMTLKKGKGLFKPKVGVRKPGTSASTQSSARPSVERQSQTPAPTTRPKEPIVIPDQHGDDDLPGEASIDETTPQSSTLLRPEASSVTTSTDNSLKRKAATDDHSGLGSKRTRVDSQSSNDVGRLENETNEERGTAQRSIHTETRQVEPAAILPPIISRVQESIPSTPSNYPSILNTAVVNEQPFSEASSSSAAQDPRARIRSPIRENQDSTNNNSIISIVTSIDETNNPVQNNQIDRSQIRPRSHETHPTIQQYPSEFRQDNPASVYPDPELSGMSYSRTEAPRSHVIVSSATLNPDGTTVGQAVPAATLNSDGTPRTVDQQTTKTKKKPAVRRRRIVQAEQDGEDVRPTIEMQINKPRRRKSGEKGEKRSGKKKETKKQKKKRGETPEGAENEIIDRAAMTMGELCKDLKIGEKSSRHEELKAKKIEDKQKAKEARRAKKLATAEIVVENGAPVGGAAAVAAPEPESESEPAPELENIYNPVMTVINGSIEVNYRSLEVPREKAPEISASTVVVENEFSKLITSGSLMKRELPSLWNSADTALFYKGLSMFGTDFGMMAKLFPSRNRRQIKLKYGIEERDNARKLDKLLSAPKIPIDLELFTEYHKDELADVAEIEDEMREFEENERRAEEQKKLEREETDRQKRAEIQSRGAAAKRTVNNVDGGGGRESERGQQSGSTWKKGKGRKKSTKDRPSEQGDGYF